MKSLAYKIILTLVIFAWFPLQFFSTIAEADEQVELLNDAYQVELNFPSTEITEPLRLFGKTAVVTIRDGQYTLSVKIIEERIEELAAQQQGETIQVLLDKDENLVQFDMKDIQQKITVYGTLQEEPFTFVGEIVVTADSLPQEEELQPPPLVEDIEEPIVESTNPTEKSEPVQPSESIEKPSIQQDSEIVSKKESHEVVAIPEEKSLTFDRSMDEAIEEKSLSEKLIIEPELIEIQDTSQVAASEVVPVNKFKVSILVLVCLLSGVLLFRRKTNYK